MRPILWVVASLVFFAMGEACSKWWANRGSWAMASLVVACYMVGSMCWLPAIKEKNHLASLGSMWNAGAMIGTVVVGALFFQEVVTVKQWAGIVLGLCACFLLS